MSLPEVSENCCWYENFIFLQHYLGIAGGEGWITIKFDQLSVPHQTLHEASESEASSGDQVVTPVRKGSWPDPDPDPAWAVSWSLSATSFLHLTLSSDWSLCANSGLWLAGDHTTHVSSECRVITEMLAVQDLVTWQTSGCNENLITHDTSFIMQSSIRLTFPWPGWWCHSAASHYDGGAGAGPSAECSGWRF